MDSTTALVAVFVVTAAGGGIAARLAARAVAAAARENAVSDATGWRQTHQRRTKTYAAFAAAADRIGHTVALWPATPRPEREDYLHQARGHVQDLKLQIAALRIEGGSDVESAALALVEQCTRLVDGLRLDADVDPAALSQASYGRLSRPFLDACREYLDAEADRYFGLRRPAGRSLFARLSSR